MSEMERWELIYLQINGGLEEEEWQGIANETAPGGALHWITEEIYHARRSLCMRTGLSEEGDRDLERLTDGFERLCRICGELMYGYGKTDGCK